MAELVMIEKWAENLDEATVGQWLVSEGDEVEAGDGLCEIITDKATFEYEAETSGTVKAIYAAPRSTVPVGYIIAFIGGEDEEPPDDIERRNAKVMDEHRAASQEEFELELDLQDRLPQKSRRPQERSKKVRGTPAARKLARDRDVSLEEVAEALDLHGVVTEEHVRRFVGEE